MASLLFSELLEQVGLEPRKVKLIRHSLSDVNFRECAEAGLIYEYTCHQRKTFGKGFDYWAVFISEEGTLARFYALYKNNGLIRSDIPETIPVGTPESEAAKYTGEHGIFSLEKVDYLKQYENKLIIEWGKAPIVWQQRGDIEKDIITFDSTEEYYGDIEDFVDAENGEDEDYSEDYLPEYSININITTEEWCELLHDNTVFKEKDVEIIKKFYLSDNHASACYDLGLQDGVSPSSYIKPIVALARRVEAKKNLSPIYRRDGKQVWWKILFWGRRRADGHFEWKIRPELSEAISKEFPDWDLVSIEEFYEKKEALFFSQSSLKDCKESGVYIPVPIEKPKQIMEGGRITYFRDRQRSIHALELASYLCEYDTSHPLFIRKNSEKNYTEPHHLIPMAFQSMFSVSLDVEANIVSLCSNCHNQIHYGADAETILRVLYDQRKEQLEQAGIIISFDELLRMYNI